MGDWEQMLWEASLQQGPMCVCGLGALAERSRAS